MQKSNIKKHIKHAIIIAALVWAMHSSTGAPLNKKPRKIIDEGNFDEPPKHIIHHKKRKK